MQAKGIHPSVFQDSPEVMNPQINAAFQADEENGYFTLSFREPGKLYMKYHMFILYIHLLNLSLDLAWLLERASVERILNCLLQQTRVTFSTNQR